MLQDKRGWRLEVWVSRFLVYWEGCEVGSSGQFSIKVEVVRDSLDGLVQFIPEF